MFNQQEVWPPHYKIRYHKKAKRVKLKISTAEGLEITLPTFFKEKNLPSILEENKDWILRQLIHIKPVTTILPDNIIFHSIKETWTIKYVAATARLTLIELPTFDIVLVGNIQDQIKCKKLLITWIKKKANIILQAKTKELALLTHLSFTKLSIRQQKSRWGSCSSNQMISLNMKLIFLPIHLVEHIIIHELCHTKYLNHSDKFWKLVEKYDPDYKKHKKELKKADEFISDLLR